MSKVELKQTERRKELAKLAIPIIEKHGFNSVTVATLCSELGISIGTFYHYFQDKNSIIMEFFNILDNYYKEKIIPKLDNESNAIDKIKVLCSEYGEYCKICGIEICRQISVVPLISYKDDFMSKKRYLYTVLDEIIIEGQKKGQITNDYTSTQITDMFLIMIRGYCFDWCKENASYDIVSAIDMHSSILLSQIGRPYN